MSQGSMSEALGMEELEHMFFETHTIRQLRTISKKSKMWMLLHLEPHLVQVLGHFIGLSIEVQEHYIAIDRRKSLQDRRKSVSHTTIAVKVGSNISLLTDETNTPSTANKTIRSLMRFCISLPCEAGYTLETALYWAGETSLLKTCTFPMPSHAGSSQTNTQM